MGGIAYYDDIVQGTIGSDHDGYPGPAGGGWGDFWSPDVPDWGSYQLRLTATNWYLEFKNAALATPMSGTMDWTNLIATETDVGQYEGTVPADPDANDGGAAANGGGPGAWDMDWTWGSEVIPLELPQFKVAVEDLGSGTYRVSLTPFGRDADSYKIYFEWSQGRPVPGSPGGSLFQDDGYITLTAARTSRAFNVYAKNNSTGVETDRVEDHSAWPTWYANYGWDTPDADPLYNCSAGPYECNAPFYLLTIDTYQKKWWLFYTQYPNQPSTAGIANLYVPMSGKTKKVTINDDDTIDIEIKEDGGDWKTFWGGGAFEVVKLQDKHFVVHLDPDSKTGYMAPKQLVKGGKPLK